MFWWFNKQNQKVTEVEEKTGPSEALVFLQALLKKPYTKRPRDMAYLLYEYNFEFPNGIVLSLEKFREKSPWRCSIYSYEAMGFLYYNVPEDAIDFILSELNIDSIIKKELMDKENVIINKELKLKKIRDKIIAENKNVG